jgi:hypothetical protein
MTLLDILKSQSLDMLVQWVLIGIFFSIQAAIAYRSFINNTTKDAHWCQSMGMMGTFFGIVYGMLSLDTDELFKSVNGLINGMSLAFVTSLSGMVFTHLIYYFIDEDSAESEAELSDVVKVLKNMDSNMANGFIMMGDLMKPLYKSIAGGDEGSLLNQMTLMRSNLSDKLDTLNTSFGDFAKLQAENNTKALVEAIREVIGDFNTKLNEQFGENFKELNNAVGDLVTWQDNYKETVDKSHEQFQLATTAIVTSKEMLESIEKQYEGNMKINEDVKDAVSLLKDEGLALSSHLEVFNDVANNAKNAFPMIEKNIDSLTQGFATKVDESLTNVSAYIKDQNDSAKNVIEGFNKSTNETLQVMKESIENSNNAIQESSKVMTETISGTVKDISVSLTSSFEEAMNNINQIQQKIGENMENTIHQIDESHRQELENSLQSLGSQLASLSNRFVDDYAKITSRMNDLITMAQG